MYKTTPAYRARQRYNSLTRWHPGTPEHVVAFHTFELERTRERISDAVAGFSTVTQDDLDQLAEYVRGGAPTPEESR